MKKFKTNKEINKIKLFIIIISFLILFIVISLFKLNGSHQDIVLKLLNSFDNESLNINVLSNLDYLFNNYSFYEKKVAYKEKSSSIYLYNTQDTIFNSLKNNLTKLGISTNGDDVLYYIDVNYGSDSNLLTINNKSYAKIKFILNIDNKDYLKNKAILLKINNYLNNNYPGISSGIEERSGYNSNINNNTILIELSNVKNNQEIINNSTEIISLMLYHMIGD